MNRKLDTVDLKGKAYATVPTRIKEFRQNCPHGLISTSHHTEGDVLYFEARILKDKSDANSAESTGHSMGRTKDDKSFEKLETIAVGRALAMLGYMASGDIASSEEMDEFLDEKEQKKLEKIAEIKEKVDSITDLKELREYYKTVSGNGNEVVAYFTARSKELKSGK